MKITMYGISSCPDCCAAVKLLEGKGIPFEFLNFAEDPAWLKDFLQRRDKSPFFAAVRERGGIGIPYFELEDGTQTFDVDEVVAKA